MADATSSGGIKSILFIPLEGFAEGSVTLSNIERTLLPVLQDKTLMNVSDRRTLNSNNNSIKTLNIIKEATRRVEWLKLN